MKEFWCGAVVPNCEARFEADSEEGILHKVREHAVCDHGMREVPESVIEQVRKHIREAS